jgi:hypothetical protein
LSVSRNTTLTLACIYTEKILLAFQKKGQTDTIKKDMVSPSEASVHFYCLCQGFQKNFLQPQSVPEESCGKLRHNVSKYIKDDGYYGETHSLLRISFQFGELSRNFFINISNHLQF